MSKVLKTPVTALGLMSGTSLDGIDVALVETDGESMVKTGTSATYHYDDEQRPLLRQGLTDAVAVDARQERPGTLQDLEQRLTQWHVTAVQRFLQENGLTHSDINIIGFHGQTVIHRPERRLTVQLGHGDVLAEALGIPVAYDLRAHDVASGGQGAPLVPIYHQALSAQLERRPVAFVNIGGVANVTYVGEDNTLLAFDTGPGNALIDDWMKRHTGAARDEGGAVAATGVADESVIAQFLADRFFEQQPPKSLDRNSFAGVSLDGMSIANGAATLVEVTARCIALAARHMPSPPMQWVVCGGGRHNRSIMAALARLLPGVAPAEAFGFNGDAMEAEAWAYLAVRSLRGLPLTFPGTTGAPRPLSGGIIARPETA